VVVVPKTTVRLMVFDFDGPDRINWSGQNCVLVRVEDPRRTELRSPRRRSRQPAATGSRRRGFAESDRPARSPGATAVAGASGGGAAVSSLRPVRCCRSWPVSGTRRENISDGGHNVRTYEGRPRYGMAPGGGAIANGRVPLRAWIMACRRIGQRLRAGQPCVRASTVATLRTDLQGRAELGHAERRHLLRLWGNGVISSGTCCGTCASMCGKARTMRQAG